MDAEQTPQQVAPHTLISKLNLGLILTECFENSESDIHSQTFADISGTFLVDLLKPLTDSPQWIQLLLTLIPAQQKTFQQSRWPFVFSMGGVIFFPYFMGLLNLVDKQPAPDLSLSNEH